VAQRRTAAGGRTTPGAPGNWSQVLQHLGDPTGGRLDVLTTGYRIPREVLNFANRLLPHIAPGVAAATSLRSAQGSLEVRRTGDLIAAAADAAAGRTAAGSVAVVAADRSILTAVGAALAARGLNAQPLGQDGPPGPPALVPADLVFCKGLEFDSVVLLKTGGHRRDRPYGLRALYVALTRAVCSLQVLHERDLPAELR
jgi:DNA helicase IV